MFTLLNSRLRPNFTAIVQLDYNVNLEHESLTKYVRYLKKFNCLCFSTKILKKRYHKHFIHEL